MIAKIVLNYKNKKYAEAVSKAVAPDNVSAPKGLNIDTITDKNVVVTSIDLEGRLETFLSTIDDLLACVQVAEKSINQAMRLKR